MQLAVPGSVGERLESRLGVLGRELSGLVSSLDVACLSGPDAARLVSLFSSIERCASGARVLCGRRAVDARVPESVGARDGASWLASLSGSSVGAARSDLEVASGLSSLPDVGSAVTRGELSLSQAREIVAGSGGDGSVASSLMSVASSSSLSGLKRASRLAGSSSASSRSENARFERLRSSRYFRTWVDSDGMVLGSFRLLPRDGALLASRLKPFVDSAVRSRVEDDRREALVADGFCGLVETSGGSRRPMRPEVIVLADHAALVRGFALADEHCEIQGLGRVPVSFVRSLAGDCYLSNVVMKNGGPVIVRGKGRYVPNKLRTAVHVRDGFCCVVPGCDSSFRLELDHVVPLCDGGPTSLENLVSLCKAHHDQKTYRGWNLRGSPGKWSWVPPGLDPVGGDDRPELDGLAGSVGPEPGSVGPGESVGRGGHRESVVQTGRQGEMFDASG